MPDLRAALIARARERHGVVLPCATKATLEECIVDMGRYGLALYYNTPDGNTHLVREKDA